MQSTGREILVLWQGSVFELHAVSVKTKLGLAVRVHPTVGGTACYWHLTHSADVREPPEWVELTSCPSSILGWPPEACDSGEGLTWGCSRTLDATFKHPKARVAFLLCDRRRSLST